MSPGKDMWMKYCALALAAVLSAWGMGGVSRSFAADDANSTHSPASRPPVGGMVVADGVICFATRPMSKAMLAPGVNALPKDLPGLHAVELPKPTGQSASAPHP